LELFPDSVYGLVGLGDVYRAAGQKEEALRWYEKALEFARQNRQGSRALMRAGRVAQDLGQVADAAHYYEVAMEYDKDNRSLKRRVEQLRKQVEEQQKELVFSRQMWAIGQLALNITHEIRQPLNVITLTADNCSKDLELNIIEPPQIIADLTKIKRNVGEINAIIQYLRTLNSKPDAAELEVVNVNQVVEEALQAFQGKLHADQIKLECQMAAGPLLIQANKTQLAQVCVNLITNAREALTATHAKLLKVATEAKEGWVALRFIDNGSGIAPAHLAQIFEAFMTTKDKDKGTGFGLYISQQIIQKYGGTITAESTVGVETTFTIRFPLAKQEQVDAQG